MPGYPDGKTNFMTSSIEPPPRFDISKDRNFEIGGTRFHVATADGQGKSRPDSFAIVKGNQLLNTYAALAECGFKSIFEVGFFEGGSSVFLDRLFQPEQLTCVDLRPDRIAVIDRYIEEESRKDQFRMNYSVDQSDKAALAGMVETYHGGSLDLVIDDASHEYFRSKATFEALFPYLCPGGVYLLEDFAWAHTEIYQKRKRPWKKTTKALTNLVFELTMVMSSNPGLIQRIDMDRASCRIYRGKQPIEGPFLIDESYIARGKKLRLI